jgi:nicotinamide-nucleotide amidase
MNLEAELQQLESVVGELYRQTNITIAVAESCTAGLLAHHLTNMPGSSSYMMGGTVVYSNAAKVSLLGVRESLLNTVGSVSQEVAAEMARSVRALLGTAVGVGITGIAGPGGGTQEKPVGLTYISYADKDTTLVKRFVWESNRLENKMLSVRAALEILLEQGQRK